MSDKIGSEHDGVSSALKMVGEQASIEPRHCRIRVPEDSPEEVDVRLLLQEVRGKRVPRRVRATFQASGTRLPRTS